MFSVTDRIQTLGFLLLAAGLATLLTACTQGVSKAPPEASIQKTTPPDADIPEVVISTSRSSPESAKR